MSHGAELYYVECARMKGSIDPSTQPPRFAIEGPLLCPRARQSGNSHLAGGQKMGGT